VLPAIAIVGRPNVGKSTLFNFLTKRRDALVADHIGLTRDRRYGFSNYGSQRCIVVDTGGLSDESDELLQLAARQVATAIEDAQILILVVDAKEGLNSRDEHLAGQLRRLGKPLFLAVNKTDTVEKLIAISEFHVLGIGEPFPISAISGAGIRRLWDEVCAKTGAVELHAVEEVAASIRVAVIGRPNVGKSTFVNAATGKERMVTHDRPGTTRDSIEVVIKRQKQAYTLIDTAGIRRRSRVDLAIEKYSIIQSLQAIEASNVCVVLIDALEGVTEQDTRLLGQVLEAGRSLVIAINKWDAMAPVERRPAKHRVTRKISFIDFAEIHYISAKKKLGINKIFQSIDEAWQACQITIPTPELTRVLTSATTQHPPPITRGRRIKLKYAHQGGSNPPVIVVHGNQTEALPDTYKRYLGRVFRKKFQLRGTPVQLEFRTALSPYSGKRNALTERQKKRRKRLIKHRSR